ncbi:MAG: peptidylprolyl isomerase [Fibromonadales bacterium]|nr:peptidylprolyl isomerase [Fibromonadales bacterium]
MLTWISENAKWVIYIFIIGIVAGLLFMDMSGLQTDNRPPVGVVNGEKLSTDLFNMRLTQIQSQQPGLSKEQSAQMREELFRSFVMQQLMKDVISEMKITASVHEMSRDLRTDPPQAITGSEMFQTNGSFDYSKYETWLADPSTYDIPYMVEYENMLKTARIPEKQLNLFIGAGLQPSSLEVKYEVLKRETKFELLNAQGKASEFDDIEISQSMIDSVFKAEKDSFFVADDLARVNYVAISLEPSPKDIEDIYEYANMLIGQLKDGADFGDIARSSSEDPGSAAQGGELGDWGPRGRWVPAFDSAAFALGKDEISDPIRTQFGYHIIQNLGKRVVEKDSVKEEQVKARHILLSITASPETTDSLENTLADIKAAVDKKKSFEDAAKEKGLEVKASGWFKKGGEIPELGHVAGLSSYAFFNPLRPKDDSKTSEILQNQKWVVIFEKAGSLPAGSRNMEFFKTKIEQNLKAKMKADVIAEHLKANIADIEHAKKVTVDSATVAFQGFLPGLGYANTALYKALSTAKEGEWSGPYTSAQNAVMIKVLGKKVPDEATLNAFVSSDISTLWQYNSYRAFGDYMRNLEASAKIVNNVDLYYRE